MRSCLCPSGGGRPQFAAILTASHPTVAAPPLPAHARAHDQPLAPNPLGAVPAPPDRRASAAPFVTQLAHPTAAILAPQPATRSLGRQQRLLRSDTVRRDRHQRRNRSAISGNDRGSALLSRLEQRGKLTTGFPGAFARHRAHAPPRQDRMVLYSPSSSPPAGGSLKAAITL
jgi:hypothetical protein